jgi:hypothetical protein
MYTPSLFTFQASAVQTSSATRTTPLFNSLPQIEDPYLVRDQNIEEIWLRYLQSVQPNTTEKAHSPRQKRDLSDGVRENRDYRIQRTTTTPTPYDKPNNGSQPLLNAGQIIALLLRLKARLTTTTTPLPEPCTTAEKTRAYCSPFNSCPILPGVTTNISAFYQAPECKRAIARCEQCRSSR